LVSTLVFSLSGSPQSRM